jgi:hypothetical protein
MNTNNQTPPAESWLSFSLERNALGRLVYRNAHGETHEQVVPVRAFPLSAPQDGLSLVSAEGRELVWIPSLDALPAPVRALLEEELASREFTPHILGIESVSTFSTPSVWAVHTNRGRTTFTLKAEEDIRRLSGGTLLIADTHGMNYLIPDRFALDRQSRKWLERFL